jgi:hypothetical protein
VDVSSPELRSVALLSLKNGKPDLWIKAMLPQFAKLPLNKKPPLYDALIRQGHFEILPEVFADTALKNLLKDTLGETMPLWVSKVKEVPDILFLMDCQPALHLVEIAGYLFKKGQRDYLELLIQMFKMSPDLLGVRVLRVLFESRFDLAVSLFLESAIDHKTMSVATVEQVFELVYEDEFLRDEWQMHLTRAAKKQKELKALKTWLEEIMFSHTFMIRWYIKIFPALAASHPQLEQVIFEEKTFVPALYELLKEFRFDSAEQYLKERKEQRSCYFYCKKWGIDG